MVVGKGLVERGSAKGGAWGVAFPKMTRNCLPATLEAKHVELVTGKEAQRLFVPFLGYSLEGEKIFWALMKGTGLPSLISELCLLLVTQGVGLWLAGEDLVGSLCSLCSWVVLTIRQASQVHFNRSLANWAWPSRNLVQ